MALTRKDRRVNYQGGSRSTREGCRWRRATPNASYIHLVRPMVSKSAVPTVAVKSRGPGGAEPRTSPSARCRGETRGRDAPDLPLTFAVRSREQPSPPRRAVGPRPPHRQKQKWPKPFLDQRQLSAPRSETADPASAAPDPRRSFAARCREETRGCETPNLLHPDAARSHEETRGR